MNTPSDHDVASAVLIDMLGRFLFQRRDDVPGILSPGKVGLFGGHRETGETYLQSVVREVHEEIGYYLRPERFKFLAPYEQLDPVHGRFGANSSLRAECRPASFGSPKVLFSSPRARTSRHWRRNSRRQRWPLCKLF